MTTVIVSSVIANKPLNGGNAWVVLSWVRGLRQLGCQVYLVEQISPKNCVNAAGEPVAFEGSVNRQFFQQVIETFDLRDSATLIYADGAQTHGLTLSELGDVADATDLLINITGHLTLSSIKDRCKRRAYVDLDPGYTQFWQANGNDGAHLEGHDLYFTVGENIGTDRCSIPTGGIAWKPIRPPVVLEDWPRVDRSAADRFTTIASWRGGYGRVQWGDRLFGQKAHEFRRFMGLPRKCSQPFEIALDIHADDARDRRALSNCGWQLVDPRQVAADPLSFREYVQSSRAEFSVAQGIYIETGSGWFSDRTVRYLASGKPALVQDTGLSESLVADGGLVLFRTLDEAVAGAERIAREYVHHCRAARALAEKYFDSRLVLTGLFEQAGLAA